MREIDEKEKVRNKIRKLLNLSGNNPNAQEAEAAFLKAQELLLQYKIDMHEIGEGTVGIKIIQVPSHEPVNTPWARDLARIFAKNFAVMMFYRKIGVSSRICVFFGQEEDATVACGMYDYAVVWLNKSACNYATKMRNDRGIVKGVKQDYILGFLKGLEDKFEEQVKANTQYALVVVVPPKVKEEYKTLTSGKEFNHVNLSGNMSVHGSAEARAAGYQAGKSFGTDRLGGGR